jgi:hypothetical protein
MAVNHLQQFVDDLPLLVTEARRRYLRLGPAFTPKDFTVGGSPNDQVSHLPTQNRNNAK